MNKINISATSVNFKKLKITSNQNNKLDSSLHLNQNNNITQRKDDKKQQSQIFQSYTERTKTSSINKDKISLKQNLALILK
ncbi:unnamed protein product [Paramecium sonneborni]|uniref:Uncharacterized protein n=1 Tax=Paramecium sonneborni TaxID=65129 RepID=A0A8S1K1Q8_9CILI|nr:unnamed protein product [Paramecium sonneborni]